MLFLLTRELWQEVRHCARPGAQAQPGIWYWTPADFGSEEIRLRSWDEARPLSEVLARAADETHGRPVSIVVASGELSEWFERIVENLVRHPGHPRLSLMVTSCLDGPRLEKCRRFLAANRELHDRVSTFFLATRANSDLTALEPETVSADFRTFLRLLCEGRESFADSLGIFREPVHIDENGSGDGEGAGDSLVPVPGILAAMGIYSWFPPRDWVVGTVRQLLANLVALERTQAEVDLRHRRAGPGTVIGRALALGSIDEPLAARHFAFRIPEPPYFPFEAWRVPYSRMRARRQRRELYKEVERGFSTHIEELEETLAEIVQQIHRRSSDAFSEARNTYRVDLVDGVRIGDLVLLARDYFPEFDPGGQTSASSVRKGWLPDRSLDPFCDVYETIDDGIHELPPRKVWTATIGGALALFAGALIFREGYPWLPFLLVPVAFAGPAFLFGWRFWQIRKMRGEIVHLWDKVYSRLRRAFNGDIDWHLQETRCQLEQRIRRDATSFAQRMRENLDSLPWLFRETEASREVIREEARRLRVALIEAGIDEHALERLINRLQTLAELIVKRARHEGIAGREDPEPRAPDEVMDEWIDELVASTRIPQARVNVLKEEVFAAAGGWRSPPLMAPLTDAELLHGYRKVVAIPDSDISFEYLTDDLPRYSGNPVVSLRTWTGPLPGIAVCSVMTGLPDSILDYRIARNYA